jgi:hypothetical protein
MLRLGGMLVPMRAETERSGDLALTSTRLADGTVTVEVARRRRDGTWLWVIDQPSVIA